MASEGSTPDSGSISHAPATREFQLPLNLMRDQNEFMADGVAGGHFTAEVIKIVFFTDRPFLDGGKVTTARVQAATMIIRRSQFRNIIKQLTDFADGADKVIAEKAKAQEAPNASS